jgi:hypothetical protein
MAPIQEILPYIKEGLKLLRTSSFEKTGTVVQTLFNETAAKGQNIVKRTIFPQWALFEIADIHYIDLVKSGGKKVINAYNRDDRLVAEGLQAVKENLGRVINRSIDNEYINYGGQCYYLRG